MRSLRLSSLVLLLIAGCSSPYKGLQWVERPGETAFRFKPVFDKEVYRCHVDGRFLFKKFHLSGILFFKSLKDGATRVVFQNEMGYSFFDFGWDRVDSFKVVSITPQLNKAAVVKILRKDLELLLMRHLDAGSQEILSRPAAPEYNPYYRFKLQKGVGYYEMHQHKLDRIEAADKRPVTTIHLFEKPSLTAMPDSFSVVHHKAHFTITAKKIANSDAE